MSYAPNLAALGRGSAIRQNPQRSETGRPTARAIHQVRAGDQPETAKALGITIPQAPPLRANEVIPA